MIFVLKNQLVQTTNNVVAVEEIGQEPQFLFGHTQCVAMGWLMAQLPAYAREVPAPNTRFGAAKMLLICDALRNALCGLVHDPRFKLACAVLHTYPGDGYVYHGDPSHIRRLGADESRVLRLVDWQSVPELPFDDLFPEWVRCETLVSLSDEPDVAKQRYET